MWKNRNAINDKKNKKLNISTKIPKNKKKKNRRIFKSRK